MTKQLQMYGNVQAISNVQHKDLSVILNGNYEYARHVKSVPVLASEIPNLVQEYSVIFTGDENRVFPIVILGTGNSDNLYLREDGTWKAKYVPAFIRRYPFIFSSPDEGKTFTLCVDEDYQGCNFKGKGQRLFNDNGDKSDYLLGVLKFLKDYQSNYNHTAIFSRKLKDMDLLEPMTANIKTPSGRMEHLTGFMAVKREKIKKINEKKLHDLVISDELELIYLHINSLRNFSKMFVYDETKAPKKRAAVTKKHKKKPAKKKTSKKQTASGVKKKGKKVTKKKVARKISKSSKDKKKKKVK